MNRLIVASGAAGVQNAGETMATNFNSEPKNLIMTCQMRVIMTGVIDLDHCLRNVKGERF